MKQHVPLFLLLFGCLTARGQPGPPCYFGECDTTPPAREAPPSPRPKPSPEPSPEPVPRPEPRPQPAPTIPRADREVPPFFARNMCFRGNVAVPVNDGETCSRLYRSWGSRPTDGSPVQCGILTPEGGGSYSFRIVLTETVGQCFNLREELGSSEILGRCNTNFPAGYVHWRHDLTESQCMSRRHPAIIIH